MRQKGQNNKPTCSQFQQHFRTFLINHIGTKHSANANCQDDTKSVLSSVLKLVQSPPEVAVIDDCQNDVTILENTNIPLLNNKYISKQATGYVTGIVLTNVSTEIKNCIVCKNDLFSENVSEEWHALIRSKEYSGIIPRKLQYCEINMIFFLRCII